MSKRTSKNGIYNKAILARKISIPFNKLGNNFEQIILETISRDIDGVCITEGYIKPDSINILQYSSGIVSGKNCIFEIVFETLICRPFEGMKFKCLVKNVTKAGIRAEIKETISPVVIFIARDHNYANKYFSSIKNDDVITVKVIGIRYELNDKYISVLGELVETKKKKKKIILEEDIKKDE